MELVFCEGWKVSNWLQACLNSLPKDTIFDSSKLKISANDKINVIENSRFIFGKVRKHCERGEHAV